MEKTILDPKEDLYWKQYDRLVDQQREEVKELYWLHNFFFVIESAIFLLFLRGDLKRLPPIFVEVFGVIISLTWWLVCWKQKRWKDYWVKKIKDLDRHLDDKHRMFVDRNKDRWHIDIFRNRSKVSSVMLILPVLFLIIWIISMFI
jgi:hypothetical protein